MNETASKKSESLSASPSACNTNTRISKSNHEFIEFRGRYNQLWLRKSAIFAVEEIRDEWASWREENGEEPVEPLIYVYMSCGKNWKVGGTGEQVISKLQKA